MRVGTVCYATEQGIGYLPKWFYDAGVITDVMVFRHGSRPSKAREWYPFDTKELVGRPFNGPDVDTFLYRVGAMLFFETPFDWSFINYCYRRGVKTLIVPMYECTPAVVPAKPDRWICSSKLDLQYFPDSPYVPIPVPQDIRWSPRTKARRFLHNAGNIGLREHKGTRQILQAMEHVQRPIHLTVRAQDTEALKRIATDVYGADYRARRFPSGAEVEIVPGAVSREELFDGFDVFVMAEKYNGLSLPLMEARASGLVVVTSNRFPTNDWLPTKTLIPVSSYSKQRVSGAFNFYEEADVRPEMIAMTLENVYDMTEKDVLDYSEGGLAWATENSWDVLRDRWIEEIRK